METQISKKEKEEIKEMTELVMQLTPEQRSKLKSALVIGKVVFRTRTEKKTEDKELELV